MRSTVLSALAMSTMAVMALSFGACAASNSGSPCLDKCSARGGSSLDRSSCELDCKQTTSVPTSTGQPSSLEPAPAPMSDPGQPQPAQSAPAPTGPKQYAGDTGPRQAPPGSPAVRPATPQPGTTSSTPAGPSMAELQAQRSRCENTCDADNARPSDRSTCRLRCAQITDRPSNTNIPPSTGTSTPTQPGATTQPAPADRASITACEAGCNSDATRPTDRATCRLNCNAVGTVGPDPGTQKILHGDVPSGTNRADVIRSSGGVVKQSTYPTPADPQKAAQCATQAQQCSSTCATQQEPCNRGCDEGKFSATDRATCRLTCDGNLDGCRDDCRIKEGTCRGPTVKR